MIHEAKRIEDVMEIIREQTKLNPSTDLVAQDIDSYYFNEVGFNRVIEKLRAAALVISELPFYSEMSDELKKHVDKYHDIKI